MLFRSSQLLAAVQKDLATAGVKVEVVGDQCYGQDRTGLLNRARIVLHLHNFAWDPPWLRLLLATSCGAMMVSEPIADNSLYQPGIHFIHAPINQLAATILHYLENESERKKIVQTAQKFVSTEVTLQASVRAMVNHVLSLPDR